jgi:hypothetical protein
MKTRRRNEERKTRNARPFGYTMVSGVATSPRRAEAETRGICEQNEAMRGCDEHEAMRRTRTEKEEYMFGNTVYMFGNTVLRI